MALRVLITGSTPRLGLGFQFVQLALWLRRQGVDVELAGCDGESSPGLFDQLNKAEIPFHDVPGLRRTGIPELMRPDGGLEALLRRIEPDVAIITTVGHLAETRRLKRGRPCVVWWLQSVRNTRKYSGLARRLAALTVNRRADEAWVQCELERRYMTAHGLRNGLTQLVPTPVDVDWWRERAALPLPGEFADVAKAKAAGRPILVYPASLLPAKRHDTLLRAVSIVNRQFPGVFVCCPGRFSATALRALAESLGVGGQIMFTEAFVRQEAIPPLLAAADVHVFPSAGETYGKALIEGWCIGTPTVCTRVGVGLEAEQAGVARVCNVGDHEAMARHIIEILSSAALAESMRGRARRWIEGNYSFDAVGGKMIALMRRLVDGKRGTAVGA